MEERKKAKGVGIGKLSPGHGSYFSFRFLHSQYLSLSQSAREQVRRGQGADRISPDVNSRPICGINRVREEPL